MKNSKLVKIVIGALISLIVIVMASQVFADNGTDLTNILGNSSSTNNPSNNTTNNSSNNTSNNTTRNNTLNNTSVLTTNNTSNYNNTTSLPKTGIEDTIPATILLVIFGISAVYAYKKMRDYKNI